MRHVIAAAVALIIAVSATELRAERPDTVLPERLQVLFNCLEDLAYIARAYNFDSNIVTILVVTCQRIAELREGES